MKKVLLIVFMLIMAMFIASCSEDIKPKTATYTVNGDMETATFYLNAEEKVWTSSSNLFSSFQLTGELKIEGNKITATQYDSQVPGPLEFEILSENKIKAVKVPEGFFGDKEAWIKEGDVFIPFADKDEGGN